MCAAGDGHGACTGPGGAAEDHELCIGGSGRGAAGEGWGGLHVL